MNRRIPQGDQPALARFNQLNVTRFRSDINKAIGHSGTRNSYVAQATSFFSLIRNVAPTLTIASVIIRAAQRKMFSSTGGYQAAHYLPGQIEINNDFPWRFLPNPNARQRLESLFAGVEHLPPAFNKADSAAEDKGLRETFRAASEAILVYPSTGKGLINRSLVRRIYDDLWVPGASKAYGKAISQKSLVSEVPPLEHDSDGNITNSTERSTADWDRQDELEILGRYAEALRSTPPDLKDEKMTEIEASLRS